MAVDAVLYEGAVYDGSDTYDSLLPTRIVGGGYTVAVAYYRANVDNAHLADISALIGNGEVSVDLSAAVPSTFRGDALEAGQLNSFSDWIAPVLSITRPTASGVGVETITQQLGLYAVQPPRRDYTAMGGTETIDGRDATWRLASAAIASPYNIAAGTNYSEAVRTLIESVGITRHGIQSTSKTLPRKRSWKPKTTKLQIVNDLLRSNGFYPIWADRTGRLRSRRSQRLHGTAPARTISSSAGDVVETVTLDPDLARLANHIIVIGNKPNGDAVIAERLNDDPDSPTSTVRLGTEDDPVIISKVVEDSSIDDQDAADQLADRLMDQASSVYQRMTVTTMPVLDWTLHDLCRIDIETDAGEAVASGTWRWEKLTMGIGLDAETHWTFAKVQRWEQVS